MTVIEAVNTILRGFPNRWPIPLPISAGVFTALTIAINSWVAFDRSKDFLTTNEFVNFKQNQCRGEAFDYIVVGAGAAGMVVATRIANSSLDKTVLLLEAGGEPSILNGIPSMALGLMYQPDGNTWLFNTTSQQYACGHCDGRRTHYTGGRMLGGSTNTNTMMYVRGNRDDFNRWSVEDAGGDPQWSYEGLLPYFKKSEDYNGAHRYSQDAGIYRGKGGLLNIDGTYLMVGTEEFIAAAREKGYKIGDYNGADQEVFSPIDVTTQDGWRESTYRAFYTDTGKAPNLCIRKYAFVTRVNFEKSLSGKPRAVGVTYTRHKKVVDVWARNEVILSAGSIGSAKLLLLSGVGPRVDLEALNIPVIADLPVGQAMQDHPLVPVGPFLRSPSINQNRDLTPQAAARFLIDGGGVIASPAGSAGLGFLTSPYASPPYPDLQLVHAALGLYPELPADLGRYYGYRASVLDSWFHPYHRLNTDSRFIFVYVGRPKSVGYLRLATSNPYDAPIINPNYLKHPDDLKALVYGVKKAVDLYENTRALNTPLFHKPLPNCENHVFKSDDYYRCVVRHLATTVYHFVSTCALGKVVDNSLRVKGIEGLRVIDASVMPRAPNGNTQAATIMLGEKGADLVIRGDSRGWGDVYLKSKEHGVEFLNEVPVDGNEYLKGIPTSPQKLPISPLHLSNQQYSSYGIDENSIYDPPTSEDAPPSSQSSTGSGNDMTTTMSKQSNATNNQMFSPVPAPSSSLRSTLHVLLSPKSTIQNFGTNRDTFYDDDGENELFMRRRSSDSGKQLSGASGWNSEEFLGF